MGRSETFHKMVMTCQPFFSVVLPTYNRAHLIGRPIASVIAQTFQSWELIVVDDGSTDTTKQVVEAFKDVRIKYFFQKNQERSAARNNGINNSSGQYICFLDSDDYFLPERLQCLYDYLSAQKFPVAFYYTSKMIEHPDGRREIFDELPVSESIYDQIITSVIHSQQVCAHRDVFQKNQFNPRFRIAEDMELWLRLADNFKIEPLHQPTLVVVEHPERTINKNTAGEMLQTVRYFLDKKHSGEKISASKRKELLSNCFFAIAKNKLLEKEMLQGVGFLFKSIVSDIAHPQSKYRWHIALKAIMPFARNGLNELLRGG